MKIRFHSTYATPTARATPGQVLDLPDSVANGLVAGGYADPVDDVDGRRRRPDDAGTVPSGSVKKVLAWVGDDQERAAAALNIESERSKPRTSLTDPLMQLLAADEEE